MSEFKEIGRLWPLVDPLSVTQAAALVAGYDPNAVNSSGEYFKDIETGMTCSYGIGEVMTAFIALSNAINAGTLKATVRRSAWERGWDEEPENGQKYTEEIETVESDMWPGLEIQKVKSRGVIYRVEPDWSLTTVARADLVTWLYSSGVRDGFFFPDGTTDTPGYLDPDNNRFAPKLAASVAAWQAVTNPNGKTPKQALMKWLREHAAEYGLSDDEGKPNESGIEEVAKVANWLPGGGAAKTPGGV